MCMVEQAVQDGRGDCIIAEDSLNPWMQRIAKQGEEDG
jgi:hypothetical protein